MRLDDLQDWYGTPLGLQAFVMVVRSLVNDAQYRLLLRSASLGEPHLTEAELDEVEGLVRMVSVVLTRWEAVEVQAVSRCTAERGELALD